MRLCESQQHGDELIAGPHQNLDRERYSRPVESFEMDGLCDAEELDLLTSGKLGIAGSICVRVSVLSHVFFFL